MMEMMKKGQIWIQKGKINENFVNEKNGFFKENVKKNMEKVTIETSEKIWEIKFLEQNSENNEKCEKWRTRASYWWKRSK